MASPQSAVEEAVPQLLVSPENTTPPSLTQVIGCLDNGGGGEAMPTPRADRLVLAERNSNGNTKNSSSSSSINSMCTGEKLTLKTEGVPPVTLSRNHAHKDEAFDSVSAGLLASGLAWVDNNQNGQYGLVQSRSSQYHQQDRHKQTAVQKSPVASSNDVSPTLSTNVSSTDSDSNIVVTEFPAKGSPTHLSPHQCTSNTSVQLDIDIQAGPTPPILASAKEALAGNPIFDGLADKIHIPDISNSKGIQNGRGTMAQDKEPGTIHLKPRLEQNSNAASTSCGDSYSISNLLSMTVSPPQTTPTGRPFYDCTASVMDTDDDDDASNVDGSESDNIVIVNGDDDDDDYQSPMSFGYFCQAESTTAAPLTIQDMGGDPTKSPFRAAFDQVLAGIGSTLADDDCSISEEYNNSGDDNNDGGNDNVDADHECSDDEDETAVSWIPPVRCVPESYTTSAAPNILKPQEMHQIARHVLPKGIACCQWKRLYSLARDGDSFDMFLHYVQQQAKTLLVIRTTRGAIFGGYAGEAWTCGADHHHSYYGNNETRLFTFDINDHVGQSQSNTQKVADTNDNAKTMSLPLPSIKQSLSKTSAPAGSTALQPIRKPPLLQRMGKSLVDDDDDDEGEALPPIQVYNYTGMNRYIQFSDSSRRMLAFGGGGEEGAFGLCVEQEFQRGSTGHCDTFDNEPLCQQENFKIVDVEVWGFLTGQF